MNNSQISKLFTFGLLILFLNTILFSNAHTVELSIKTNMSYGDLGLQGPNVLDTDFPNQKYKIPKDTSFVSLNKFLNKHNANIVSILSSMSSSSTLLMINWNNFKDYPRHKKEKALYELFSIIYKINPIRSIDVIVNDDGIDIVAEIQSMAMSLKDGIYFRFISKINPPKSSPENLCNNINNEIKKYLETLGVPKVYFKSDDTSGVQIVGDIEANAVYEAYIVWERFFNLSKDRRDKILKDLIGIPNKLSPKNNHYISIMGTGATSATVENKVRNGIKINYIGI